MPGRAHHSEKMRSCVEKVMADGKEESSAYAICTASLQEAGEEVFEAAAGRHLHLRGATGPALIEMWDGRPHLVVPCVALQEGVIHAVNAQTPEFVSVSALSKAASSWNGRPLVVGHPVKNGKQVSANDPAVLAAHGFGLIRASVMNGTRLGMEALVDPARLEALGQQKLLADLRAGKQVEVSVGAFVTTNDKTGTHNGRAYKAEWVDVSGDHLAFLPNGVGACSLEMGCGSHRAAMHLVTAEGIKVLGGQDGHPFYGNQYTDGSGGSGGGDGGGEGHQAVADKLFGSESASSAAAKVAEMNAETYTLGAAGKEDISTAPYDPKNSKQYSGQAKRGMMKVEYDALHARGWKQAPVQADYPTHVILRSPEGSHQVRYVPVGAKSVRSHFEKVSLLALDATGRKHKGFNIRKLEALECPHLDVIRTLLDEVSALHGEVEGYADELYEAEEAGEPVDVASLEALEVLAMQMGSMLSSVISLTYKKRAPGLPAATDARYMEAFRAAIGKEISAKNAKVIQAAHDSTHMMHDHATALGAECDRAWKWLAKYEDCPMCKGSGEKDGNPCEACDGDGYLRTAAATPQLKAACRCNEESTMTKDKRAELIAALVANKHSGYKAGDEAFLETASDARLEEFRAAAESNQTAAEAAVKMENDLRAANAKLTVIEGKLKVAEAAPTEEQWLERAPAGIKTLLENQKAQEIEVREDLIKQLKVAGANTEDELKAMPTAQLQTLAKYAKVGAPDFSGRGLPVNRSAQQDDDKEYAAPNPYEAGIKALQGAKTVN